MYEDLWMQINSFPSESEIKHLVRSCMSSTALVPGGPRRRHDDSGGEGGSDDFSDRSVVAINLDSDLRSVTTN